MSGTAAAPRHRSADVALGYAADPRGKGILYASVANAAGRTVVKVPFAFVVPPLLLDDLDGWTALRDRAMAYAAVAAVGAYLRGRGFTRIRMKLDDTDAVADLNARGAVPPWLATVYVQTRCVLHTFEVARVERAEPSDVHELSMRARADIVHRL